MKTKLTDESLMPFGKHKGVKLANVPSDYLLWLYDNNKVFGDLKEYIKNNLDVLRKENHENFKRQMAQKAEDYFK